MWFKGFKKMGFRERGYFPQKKKRPSRRKGLVLFLIFVLGVVVLLGLDLSHKRSLKELATLKERNSDLEKKVERLKKDPRFYEEIARKKYGYVKSNERLLKFSK